MAIQTYRPRTEIQAIQWDGTARADDEIFDWAVEVWMHHEDGSPKATRHVFLSFLPDNDFVRDELSAEEIASWKTDGASAVLLDNETGHWTGVHIGWWIVRTAQDVFRALPSEEFADTYEQWGA